MTDSEENEERIASEVLGAVRKPRPTGRYVVTPDAVSGPLVYQETVVRAPCLGCGYCLEIPAAAADRLAKLAGAAKPDSWDGYYFVAQRCPICDKDYRDVAIKSIRDMTG